ncbi:flagellar L-ring protein [Gammaproteobacteria bacterium]
MTTQIRITLLFLGVLFLAGCAETPQHDPAYAPTLPLASHTPPPRDGAIFHSGYDIVLFEDDRARRIGDILTVQLVEKTDASKKAETKIGKSDEVDISATTLFGRTPGAGGLYSWPKNKLSGSSTFDGSGDSSQSNSLSGSISVTVTEVLPNGYLMIRGDKVIGLNQGTEFVRLSGIVRPSDIRSNNTVPSTAIANATISYGGKGATDDANAMGWLGRFFISALFPF